MRDPLRFAKDVVKQRWLQARSPTVAGPSVERMLSSLRAFERVAGDTAYDEDACPVFLLAASWRTGSTMLQRVLMTDPTLLVWGEPWGRMSMLPRLCASVAALSDDWPHEENQITQVEEDRTGSFLAANLYPPGRDFRFALAAMLRRWMEEPARERGYARWGFKEVRLGAVEAVLLRWLFPKAKFVVQVRHPFDAYRSCKHWHLFYRWPDVPVRSAADFGKHWNRLAMSWKRLPEDFPCRVARFEDVVSGAFDFRALEADLGLQLDESKALDVKSGGTAHKSDLTPQEERVLRKEAGEGMCEYGYEP